MLFVISVVALVIIVVVVVAAVVIVAIVVVVVIVVIVAIVVVAIVVVVIVIIVVIGNRSISDNTMCFLDLCISLCDSSMIRSNRNVGTYHIVCVMNVAMKVIILKVLKGREMIKRGRRRNRQFYISIIIIIIIILVYIVYTFRVYW